MVGGFIRRLLGRGETESVVATETYKGLELRAAPWKSEHGWRIAGQIVGQGPEGERVREFIRADTLPSREAAAEASLGKARRIVDEAGDALFGD